MGYSWWEWITLPLSGIPWWAVAFLLVMLFLKIAVPILKRWWN